MSRRSVLVLVLVTAVGALASCGGTGSGAADTATTVASAGGEGEGEQIDVPVLDEPPAATGDTITAAQAEGVSGTVMVAWLRGDRAHAERFVASPDVLDELFGRRAPSKQLQSGQGAYCSEVAGSFSGCSYGVVDDSPDGILAVATDVAIADGVVLVSRVGFADWND